MNYNNKEVEKCTEVVKCIRAATIKIEPNHLMLTYGEKGPEIMG